MPTDHWPHCGRPSQGTPLVQTPLLASRVRFVLCQPAHPGNIGSAARAIKTMGFRDLRVVAPKVADYRTHEEAIAYATSSVDVLQSSQSHETLLKALTGVTYAWALTGYDREFGPTLTPLRKASANATRWLVDEPTGDIAFVFGCERSGLTNEEMALCQGAAAIQADPESPSLNLAQAVQLTAYEMHLALLDQTGQGDQLYDWQARFDAEVPASIDQIEGFIGHWMQAMQACGVHNPDQPKHLLDRSRQIFRRAGLTQNEVDLLRGICANIIRPKKDRAGSKKPTS